MASKTTGKLKLWIAEMTDKISDTINTYLPENFTKIDSEFSTFKDEVDAHMADMAKQIIEMPFVSGIVGYYNISYAYKVYNTVSIFVRCKKEDESAFAAGDVTVATLPAGYRPSSIFSTTARYLAAFCLTGTGGTTQIVGACVAYVTSGGEVRVSIPQGMSNITHILIPEQSFEI